MMKTKYLIVLLLFFISCKDEKKESAGNEIFFQEENALTISDGKSITLETSDDCLISYIDQIEIFNGKIFVLDAFISRKLYVFDLNGKYLASIGNRGQGPTEYILPYSFNIWPGGKKISILDLDQHAILIYELSSFQFIQKINMPFGVDDFCFLQDGNYVFLQNVRTNPDMKAFQILTTDSFTNAIQAFIPIELESGHLNPPFKNFYLINDETHGFIRFRGTVYDIQSDKVTPLYHLKFKQHDFPPANLLNEEKNRAFNANYLPWLENSGYISSYDVKETDSILCVDYVANQTHFLGFFNKNTGQTHTCPMKRFEEISGKTGINRIAGRSDNGYLIAIIYSHKYLEILKGKSLSSELLGKTLEEDNPILYLFKL